MKSVYLYLLEWLSEGVMKSTLKHAGRRKWREAEDKPLYKPSVFLYLFSRLKIIDISSIPNVKPHISYDLAHCVPLSAFCNFSAITFLICLKRFCNIYMCPVCIVCTLCTLCPKK